MFHSLLVHCDVHIVSTGLRGSTPSLLWLSLHSTYGNLDCFVRQALWTRLLSSNSYSVYLLKSPYYSDEKLVDLTPHLQEGGCLFEDEIDRQQVEKHEFQDLQRIEDIADKIVIVAQADLRARFLGSYKEGQGGMSTTQYSLIEQVGRGLDKGVNKLEIAARLRIKPKEIFSLLKTPERENLMYLVQQMSRSEKRKRQFTKTLYVHKIALSRLQKDDIPRPNRHQELKLDTEEDEMEVDANIIPRLLVILQESPGQQATENDLRSRIEQSTHPIIYDWSKMRDMLFATEKVKWVYHSSSETHWAEFIKIAGPDEIADLPCQMPTDSFIPPGESAEQDDESIILNTVLELPNRSQLYRFVMDTKTAGVHTSRLSKSLGLMNKYVNREVKWLRQPQSGLVSVGDRIGKHFMYKLYGQDFAPVKNPADRAVESNTTSEGWNWQNTYLTEKRIRWVQEIVKVEKVIQEKHLVQIIRHREGTRAANIANRTLKWIADKLATESVLSTITATIQDELSSVSKQVRIFADSTVNLTSSEFKELVQLSISKPDPFPDSDGEKRRRNMFRSDESLGAYTVWGLFSGFVTCSWIRLALMHIHLATLVLLSPGHRSYFTMMEVVQTMPFCLYLQICGASENIPLSTGSDPHLSTTPIFQLPSNLRDEVFTTLGNASFRQNFFVTTYLCHLTSLGFIEMNIPNSDLLSWSVKVFSSHKRFMDVCRIDSVESVLSIWDNMIQKARRMIDKPDENLDVAQLFPESVVPHFSRKTSWRVFFNMISRKQSLLDEYFSKPGSEINPKVCAQFLKKFNLRPVQAAVYRSLSRYRFYQNSCIIFHIMTPFKSKQIIKPLKPVISPKKPHRRVQLPRINLKLSISRRQNPIAPRAKRKQVPPSTPQPLPLKISEQSINNSKEAMQSDAAEDTTPKIKRRKRAVSSSCTPMEPDIDSEKPDKLLEEMILQTDAILSKEEKRKFALTNFEWDHPVAFQALADAYSPHENRRKRAFDSSVDFARFKRLHILINTIKLVMCHPENGYNAAFAFRLLGSFSDHEILSAFKMMKMSRLITNKSKSGGNRALLFSSKVREAFRFKFSIEYFTNSSDSWTAILRTGICDSFDAQPADQDGALTGAVLTGMSIGNVEVDFTPDFQENALHGSLELQVVDPLQDIIQNLFIESSTFDFTEVEMLDENPYVIGIEKYIDEEEFGRTMEEIYHHLLTTCKDGDVPSLNDSRMYVQHLLNFERIIEVPILEERRYISARHTSLFTFPILSESDGSSESSEKTAVNSSSETCEQMNVSWDTRAKIYPWTLFSGKLNTKFLQELFETILSIIWEHVGIDELSLSARIPIVSLSELHQLLDVLELDGKIRHRVLYGLKSVLFCSDVSCNKKGVRHYYPGDSFSLSWLI